LASNDKKVYTAGIVIFLLALIGALVTGENVTIKTSISGASIDFSQYEKKVSLPFNDAKYADEGTPLKETYTVPDLNVCNLSYRLTWTDEEDMGWIGSSPNHENQPDAFTITIESPDGSVKKTDSGSNSYGQDGLIEGVVELPISSIPSQNGTGNWNITISVDAGDHEPARIGLFRFLDNGNDYNLELSHEYYTPKK